MRWKTSFFIVFVALVAIVTAVSVFNAVQQEVQLSSNEYPLCNQIGWDCPENNDFIVRCSNPPLSD